MAIRTFWGKIIFIVSLIVLVLFFSRVCFGGIVKTQAGGQDYDYLVPLGDVSGILGVGGAVVLDKRTGNIWVFGVDPETYKLVSEYCGHIEEFIQPSQGEGNVPNTSD